VIVLDASALIAFLDPADALHGAATASMLALEGRRLMISPLTHAEVLVGPVRAGTLGPTRAAMTDLAIAEVALPADAAIRLAQLRARTRLRLPVCCVVLAAQQSRAAILTFDDRLAAAACDLEIGVVAPHAPG